MAKHLLLSASFMMLAACANPGADVTERDHILAVGSSTVYPFTKAVAEQLQRRNVQMPGAVIQATGTGQGIAAFCAGVGAQHPDIVDASRRMRPAELESCRANGVTSVVELAIGSDGIAFVQSHGAPPLRLSRKQVYEALAATPYGEPNRAMRWKDVDPSLPDIPIRVYGPPVKDGTRDSLVELVMQPGCEADPRMARLKEDPRRLAEICTTIRSDAAYKSTGEDDDKTKLTTIVNPATVGIFGYSFLASQPDQLRAIPIDGVAPSLETISTGRYPVSRPLYVYAKQDHVTRIPALKAFIAEYAAAIGPGGYLAKRGLVPAPDAVRTRTAQRATTLTPLQPASLTE